MVRAQLFVYIQSVGKHLVRHALLNMIMNMNSFPALAHFWTPHASSTAFLIDQRAINVQGLWSSLQRQHLSFYLMVYTLFYNVDNIEYIQI